MLNMFLWGLLIIVLPTVGIPILCAFIGYRIEKKEAEKASIKKAEKLRKEEWIRKIENDYFYIWK